MLRLLGVCLSVGLADSINPSTVGPGLFLATGQSAIARVSQFTLGVFCVNLLVGLALTVGPGRILVHLVPSPKDTIRHLIELVAGAMLVGAALYLWVGRRRLAERQLPGREAGGGSAFMLGAALAAVELPTAAPYLAVLAGIVVSQARVPGQVVLVAVYNLAFVAPLLAIVAVLAATGERADRWLNATGEWLQRRWPVVLATILLLLGGGLLIVAGVGLVKR